MQERFYELGGKFLPLSVWEAKGFDAEQIATRSADADMEEHPVVGMCYRVAIISSGRRQSTGQREEVQFHPKAPAKAAMPASSSTDAAPAPQVLEDDESMAEGGSGSEEDDSSSSSSSDSSSTSVKNKKRRRSKKHDKKVSKKRKQDKKQDKKKKNKKSDKTLRTAAFFVRKLIYIIELGL